MHPNDPHKPPDSLIEAIRARLPEDHLLAPYLAYTAWQVARAGSVGSMAPEDFALKVALGVARRTLGVRVVEPFPANLVDPRGPWW